MKVIKWIINIGMIITLLAGIGMWQKGNSTIVLPKSVDELEKVRVKVRSFSTGLGYQHLTPQEYHIRFVVPGPPAKGVLFGVNKINNPDFNYIIRVGDSADIYLTREDAKILQDKASNPLPYHDVIAYGIIMGDGKIISDPNEALTGNGFKYSRQLGFDNIAVAVSYFLILILYSVFRSMSRQKVEN